MVMSKHNKQTSFADNWLEGRIPENDFHNQLRQWAKDNLDEDEFKPLFSDYGRPSVPPLHTFLGILVQLENGFSDRELELESEFDDRVKYGILANRNFEGIDAVTLCDHRKRFFESDIGLQILAKTIQSAKEEGLFSEENLHVVDSFMVWGAAAKQDTYTLIYQGIKMVLRFTEFYEIRNEAQKVLNREDYESDLQKPDINWENQEEKEILLENLVKDALSLIEFIHNQYEEESLPEDLANTCTLLEKVATQDVNIEDDGSIEMKQGTAKERVISINDPEMRHGRKTTSQKNDGYKAEIITGGKNGRIVTGVKLDAANTPDGQHLSDLIDQSEENGASVDKVHGDSSYGDWETIEKYEEENEVEFCIKIPSAVNPHNEFTKDDFYINTATGEIICPGKQKEEFDENKIENREKTRVRFPADVCNNCALKDKCTTSEKGRTISIHPYEDRIQKQKQYQQTDEFEEEYSRRAHGERTISFLTRCGARIGRYFGKAKTQSQVVIAAIANNIKGIMSHKAQSV
jgi:hypothetical protein